MRKEQRAAASRTERQGHTVIVVTVAECRTIGPALMINGRLDGVRRRGCGQNVGDQALVPTPDRMVHLPAVTRAPVPVQRVTAIGVPVPLDFVPKPIDRLAQSR